MENTENDVNYTFGQIMRMFDSVVHYYLKQTNKGLNENDALKYDKKLKELGITNNDISDAWNKASEECKRSDTVFILKSDCFKKSFKNSSNNEKAVLFLAVLVALLPKIQYMLKTKAFKKSVTNKIASYPPPHPSDR